MIKYYIGLIWSLAFLGGFFSGQSLVFAADMTIDMLNKDANGNKMVYSKEVAKVAVGETITWLPASKGHNVEFIAGPAGFSLPKRSKMNKQFDMVLDIPGVYYYWCTPHKGTGMIGLIVVGKDISNKNEISNAKAVGKSKKKLASLIEKLND